MLRRSSFWFEFWFGKTSRKHRFFGSNFAAWYVVKTIEQTKFRGVRIFGSNFGQIKMEICAKLENFTELETSEKHQKNIKKTQKNFKKTPGAKNAE